MSAEEQQNISIVKSNGEKQDLPNASWIQVNFADSSQRTILINEVNTPFTGNYQQIQMNFTNQEVHLFTSNNPGNMQGTPSLYEGKGSTITIKDHPNSKKRIDFSISGNNILWQNIYEGSGSDDITIQITVGTTSTTASTSTKITPIPTPSLPPTEIKLGQVVGKQIYQDANPPHLSGVTGGGDVESHGFHSGGHSKRREWEITTPHLNCEVTGYFKVTEKKEDTISIKLRGPKHSDPVPESDQCANIHYIPFSGKKGGKVFGKQCPHVEYL